MTTTENIAAADNSDLTMTENIAVADNGDLTMTEDLVVADNNGLAMIENIATPTFNPSLRSGMYGRIATGDQTPIEIGVTNNVLDVETVGGNSHDKYPLRFARGFAFCHGLSIYSFTL